MAIAVSNVRMDVPNGRGVHSFFLPRGGRDTFMQLHRTGANNEPGLGGAVEAGDVPNHDRRKRRRTESPQPHARNNADSSANTWLDQLEAAASGAPADQTVQPGVPSFEASKEEQSKKGARKGSISKGETGDSSTASRQLQGDRGVLAQRSRASSSSTVANNELAAASSGRHSSANPSSTPPKKMLKLRSDGKLRSPKSLRHTTESKSRRKRKSSESHPGQRSSITVIRYGTDAASRLAIAQKINTIYEGRTIVLAKVAKDISPAKSNMPAKPTHPFFLGKAAKIQESGLTQINEGKQSCTQNQSEILKLSSPSKASLLSKVSSKPAWSDIVGSFQKPPRHAGTLEALWPPSDMVRILPLEEHFAVTGRTPRTPGLALRPRKLKNAIICVTENESVLTPYQDVVEQTRSAPPAVSFPTLQKPVRKIMTGRELQRAVRQTLATSIPEPQLPSDSSMDELSAPQPWSKPAGSVVHSGLRRMYQNMASSLSAFDEFKCETQDWASKYAPKRSVDVLQPGQEIALLRDWIRSLTISAVERRDPSAKRTRDSSAGARNGIINIKKRRKKRAKALDGFVVSSDEEADQMDVIDDTVGLEPASTSRLAFKGSMVRSGGLEDKAENTSNAVVISGPHGCGKTAAVYAVAQELGFEVFEINAGSRRSGRDLLDKVGDMTRNHLVQGSHKTNSNEGTEEADDLLRLTTPLELDIEDRQQGKLQSFFKPDPKAKQKSRGRPRKQKDSSSSKPSPKKPKAQKQSVILLEEVDLLFEEDKQFWTTTLEMITRSKRPIIMTCADECYLPWEDLPLFAVLRLQPPPESLAVDYLLLLACREGHSLSPDAVSSLYKSKQCDLRASIAELQFFCQMAIGDTEGGLAWFPIRSTSKEHETREGEALRVVSVGSYPSGISWLGHSSPVQANDSILEREIELLSEIWHGWGGDLADSESFINLHSFADAHQSSTQARLDTFVSLDNAYDSLSAADMCSPLGMRQGNTIILDTTHPKLPEKSRSNYIEGAKLLEAEPLVDQSGTSTNIALTLRALSRLSVPKTRPLDPTTLTQTLPHIIIPHPPAPAKVTPQTLSTAFSPLLQKTTTSPNPQISVLVSPASAITTDIAPYIRSITAFDLHLEEVRRQLEMSDTNNKSGGAATRVRKTRASRAALEGGAKATTRRERWFQGAMMLDFGLVRETGGERWGCEV
ncbi:MAG: hypothetical protein Q9191_001646 [Dirinaria sp. TL-2023a]